MKLVGREFVFFKGRSFFLFLVSCGFVELYVSVVKWFVFLREVGGLGYVKFFNFLVIGSLLKFFKSVIIYG